MTELLLTNSEMTTWRKCKRKWYLSHYRKLRKRNEHEFNKPLGIGNRVHDALAAYYDPAQRTDPVQFVRGTVARDVEAHPELVDDIRKEEAWAVTMLEGYLEWLADTGEDQAIRVIETERARSAQLEPNRPNVRLLTKLDARVQHEVLGDRLALEHKTVSSLKQHLPELQINTQCLTEHLTEYLALKEEGLDADSLTAKGVLFNMLLKSKRTARAAGPFYSRHHVRHSQTQLRNHWWHVVAIADEIEAAHQQLDNGGDHHVVCHPNPSADCHWSCQFFHVCPMIDTNDDHEGYLADKFEVGDPLARYRGLLAESVEFEHESNN